MSMLGNTIASLRTLIFGHRCLICGESISDESLSICNRCRLDIPLTNYITQENNPVKERFDGLVAVERASAMYFYVSSSRWQELIHRFKYSGKWQLAYAMGRWYGALLKESGLYDDVDVIVPVPLHPLKILKRGYNQSRYIADGMAKQMSVNVDARSVRRVRNNPSQASRSASDRWENVEALFGVRSVEALRGKHILLVDDVLTTGATITSCIKAIQDTVSDCKISVAALSTTIRSEKL